MHPHTYKISRHPPSFGPEFKGLSKKRTGGYPHQFCNSVLARQRCLSKKYRKASRDHRQEERTLASSPARRDRAVRAEPKRRSHPLRKFISPSSWNTPRLLFSGLFGFFPYFGLVLGAWDQLLVISLVIFNKCGSLKVLVVVDQQKADFDFQRNFGNLGFLFL